MTSVSHRRWHEIPSQNGRVNRVENLLIDVYAKIAQLNERVEQLELENEHLRNNI